MSGGGGVAARMTRRARDAVTVGPTSSQPRSNKRLASLAKSATEDCGLAFFRGRLVLSF